MNLVINVSMMIAMLLLNPCSTSAQSLSTIEYQLVPIFSIPAVDESDIENFLQMPVSLELFNDAILVADSRRNAILKYSLDGEFLGVMAGKGFGPGEVERPSLIRASESGDYLWILSNGRFSQFGSSGEYISSCIDPIRSFFLDILDRETLIAVKSRPDQRGGLSSISTSGDIQWTSAPLLAFPGAEQQPQLYNQSVVCVLEGEIWQFFTYLNTVRVFSKDGVLLRTLSLSDDLVTRTDTANREGIIRSIRQEETRGAYVTMVSSVREAFQAIWVNMSLGRPRPAPWGDTNRKHLLRINAEGNVIERYFFDPPNNEFYIMTDAVPIQDHPNFLAIVLTIGDDPKLFWCKAKRIQ